jgi:hypothetical protein
MRVVDTYGIAERGLIVEVRETSTLPLGKSLTAEITLPDGTKRSTQALKERLLRRSPAIVSGEAFLLVGLSKGDVPIGSEILLTVDTSKSS